MMAEPIALDRRRRGKDQYIYKKEYVQAESNQVGQALHLATGCSNGLERSGGESGRRTGVAPLGRRCWARARKPEQPSRRRTAMPKMAEPKALVDGREEKDQSHGNRRTRTQEEAPADIVTQF